MVEVRHITGLVLAGGRGTRMGGVDKGLQDFQGQPLALHALNRLQPQVATLMLNANRHLADYAAFGVPVWPDADAEFTGPLAGMLAGLTHCTTPFLATVPCDAPLFPLDLVQRLAAVDADIVVATAADDSGVQRLQPVFCLLRTDLHASLAQFLAAGGRKVGQWMAQHHCVRVAFAEPQAFANANTQAELTEIQHKINL
ncbi:molybdenum cofactor guanylyltransferase MobA [Rhodoferax sp.]|uniref:molybdenum cofactor guanylyltransferase MobA n=1 Tax=Rhodoferax sp. TaxID=50421 RepID=UPI0025E5C4E8|nr:molybdenum cofactor guanylyltransferase MobA [Rhodoferax sp.]